MRALGLEILGLFQVVVLVDGVLQAGVAISRCTCARLG